MLAADDVRAAKGSIKDPAAAKIINTLMKDGSNTLPNMKGIYALTPTGKLLAPSVGPHEQDILTMLPKALARWQAMDRKERLLPQDPAKLAVAARAGQPHPEGGLILQIFSRDLPHEGGGGGGGNQDFAWFKQDEVRSMIPTSKESGARHVVPEKLARRLARFHLVDNVRGLRGEGIQTGKADVKKAELVFVVKEVREGQLHLRIEGAVRTEYTVQKGADRGYEARLLGRAVCDPARGEFTSFELVAVGARWGERPARKGGPEEAPLGFALRLVPPAEWATVVPPGQYRRGGYFE